MLEARENVQLEAMWGMTQAASRVASSRKVARSAPPEASEGAAEVDAVDDLVDGRDVTVPR
jgi:hypothetical protein